MNSRKREATIKVIISRSRFALFVVILLMAFLVMRLVELQITGASENKNNAVTQYTYEITLNANRGDIYDRTGTILLAESSKVYTIFIAPYYFKENDAAFIAKNLAEILDADENDILERSKKTSSKYQTIKKDVSEETKEEINRFRIDNNLYQQVCIEETTKRTYPFGSLASHLIGFVGAENNGLDGIEKTYNDIIKGINGRAIKGQDGLGNELPFPYNSYVAPENGNSLILTIDWTIQSIVEKYLKQAYEEHQPAEGVRAIMLEVKTGEILAMASYPDYDLNDWNKLSDYYQTMYDSDTSEKKSLNDYLFDMWKNKAVSELYEPGSTFKMITTAIGIEEGSFLSGGSEKHYNCPGSIKVGSTTIRCHSGKVHGSQSVGEALFNSCNPALVQMGLDVGAETFFKYYEEFGYTAKTGSDVTGETGSIYYGLDKLNDLNLANSAFGQAMSVSLLQHIRALSAIANDGVLTTPHIVKGYKDTHGNIIANTDYDETRQVVSKETADTIMGYLVNSTKNACVTGYNVVSKTGTSQKMSKIAESGNEAYYISSCVTFAPAEDPEVAIIVIVDEPKGEYYGSQVAAPVISNILTEVLPYLRIQPLDDDTVKTEKLTNYKGVETETAKHSLESLNMNLNVITRGSGSAVTGQMPRSGEVIQEGGTVILYTDEDYTVNEVQMRDLSKMTYTQLKNWITQNKLNLSVTGIFNNDYKNCEVNQQSVEAGEMVKEGSVITVNFIYNEEIE